jgi:DNA-binding MurR/RpiR family transcriptional regulator
MRKLFPYMDLTTEICSATMCVLQIWSALVSSEPILLKLKRWLPSLAEKERKAADYILRYPYDVIGWPITTFSQECGASNTTIFRLCRRLAGEGYRRFKIELAKEIGSPDSLVYPEVQPEDPLSAIANKIFTANIQALRDTLKVLDLEALDRAVDAILAARQVDIYAVGGAGIAARELHLKCMQLGITANAYLDSQMQIMSASVLTPDDVGIGISHSGLHRHTAEALRLARASGATTISLTSYPDSPVAAEADIVLYTSTWGSPSQDSPSVRTTQLTVVDVIYEAMLVKGREQAQEKLGRVARAISEHIT